MPNIFTQIKFMFVFKNSLGSQDCMTLNMIAGVVPGAVTKLYKYRGLHYHTGRDILINLSKRVWRAKSKKRRSGKKKKKKIWSNKDQKSLRSKIQYLFYKANI